MVYFLIIKNPWWLCIYNWTKSVHQRFLLMSVHWQLYLISSVFSNEHHRLPFVLCCLVVVMSGTEFDSPLRNVALSIVREIWKLIWSIIASIPGRSIDIGCNLVYMKAAALCSLRSLCRSMPGSRLRPDLEAGSLSLKSFHSLSTFAFNVVWDRTWNWW